MLLRPASLASRPLLSASHSGPLVVRRQAPSIHLVLRAFSSSNPGVMKTGLVSCEWLHAELGQGVTDLRLVDATWYLPNSPFAAPEGSPGARGEHAKGPRLPGSRFFDVDSVSEHPSLPHMLPGEALLASTMRELGIDRSTRVVVYDRHGIFSSARFWYMLKVVFGHPADVAVLDGGLPRWQALGYPVETGEAPAEAEAPPSDTWQKVPQACWDLKQVEANVSTQEALVVDSRPAARFEAAAPEPRAGMRAGHIPGSANVPFMDLLSPGSEKIMRPKDELRKLVVSAGVPIDELTAPGGDRRAVVTSCGSGMTACILGLALHQLGLPLERWAVYDGSWSEWGASPSTPIETGPSKLSKKSE